MGGHISGLTYVFLVSYNFKSVGQQEDIDAKDDSNDYSKYVKMNETLRCIHQFQRPSILLMNLMDRTQ
ncbi:uncharacterized protein OCT59_025933 [Rhizophagus irregularis]|uniref:uncharacterized protein n=1 Tax=Rhizophagus irregularis TaxID=588596 RepID=UPI003316AB40|nr:hypothetical protein OCT59_025933 [Rhizophagus irregularis]